VLAKSSRDGAKAKKIGACFAKSEVIRARDNIESVEIETIVLPKTDGTELVLTASGKREVVASWALMNSGEGFRKFRHATNEIRPSLIGLPPRSERVKNCAAY
jgi:hypothetical protein